MKNILILLFTFSLGTLSAQTPLQANAGPDQVICNDIDDGIDPHFIGGQPSATGGVPPYTYSWSFTYSPPWSNNTSYASQFFNDTTLANPTLVSVGISNTLEVPPFVLTVTDAAGNSHKDSTQLFMSWFAAILPEHHYNIHQGDSFYMNFGPDVFGGTGSLTWLWRPNHGLIDSTNANFWAKPDTSIYYYVTATDSLGCSQKGGEGLVQVTVYPQGIENGKQVFEIKIYPNPASNFLQIETANYLINNKLQFTLYDMLGKEVLATRIQSELQQIDVNKLARGSYSFVLGSATGKIILR